MWTGSDSSKDTISLCRCLLRLQVAMMKGRRLSSVDPFTTVALFLLAVQLILPSTEATTEGDALFAMMQKWNVKMLGWESGGDPCAQNWTYQNVRCRNGRVIYLNMTGTGIIGEFPSEIGDLPYLEVLDLSNVYNIQTVKNNSLSGKFPDALAKCKNLQSFNGSNIEWGIEFPMVLTELPALQELYMSTAKLRGTFPDKFFTNLVNLRSLYIGDNRLQGDLRKFAQFKNMKRLTMYKNSFPQLIPDELSTLQELEYFNCHTCSLYGPLPESFSKLQNLQNLTLHRNNITGPIPYAWRSMTAMRNFRMDQNYLNGGYPEWMFTDWPDLNFLQLNMNSLSGKNPNFTDLEVKYNVSYDYYILKWDCNYMNGLSPCTGTNCSAEAEDRINIDKTFNFEKNCYSDYSYRDRGPVSTDCSMYHPSDVLCADFYSTLNAGGCPRCPSGQVPWPGNGRSCVCILQEHDGGTKVPVGAVVGGAMGLVAVFIVIIGVLLYKRREHFPFLDSFVVKRHRESDEGWEVPAGVERYSKQDIMKMTKNFNDDSMIGQGGFGKVFLGSLDDGRMVAIKRAYVGSVQGIFEFHNEITLLSRLHHRNLVRLFGFCDEDDSQILVYEYMTNGNLHTHLLGKVTLTPLHWFRRLEIASGVARGLEYLHTFANPCVIHRDVKPSNILLDDDMEAKLADFGISKVNPDLNTHVSTRPAGTAGYLDPDYFMRQQLTTASDIYAFGVVLLELVTGQQAIDHSRLEEFNLIEWVQKRFNTSGIVAIVDPQIESEYSPDIYSEMAKLGLQCASFNKNDRPSIQAVISVLEPLMEMRPFYTDGNSSRKESNKKYDVETKVGPVAQKPQRRPSIFDSPDNYPPNTALLSNTVRFPDHRSSGGASDTVRSNPSEGGTNEGLTSISHVVAPR